MVVLTFSPCLPCLPFAPLNKPFPRACVVSLFFATSLPPLLLRDTGNTKHLPRTFQAIPVLSLPLLILLLPRSRASAALQIIAENLQSCTVGLLLFNWGFLIHTFSPLMAPTAQHYQKKQTICAHITSHYPLSLLHLKLTDGTVVMHIVYLFIIMQDAYMCRRICLCRVHFLFWRRRRFTDDNSSQVSAKQQAKDGQTNPNANCKSDILFALANEVLYPKVNTNLQKFPLHEM